MSDPDFEHIVVGAGINGLWTAYHLASRGARVLILEKFPLPHSRGSSHGQSRGIRRAYPDPVFTQLMEEAYQGWHQLEETMGVTLMKQTGLLCFADEPQNPFVTSVLASFQQENVEHSVHRGEQFKETFPYLTFDDSVTGVVDPEAGVILADKALAAVLGLAKREGVEVRDGCEVVELESKGNLVKVVTEMGDEITCNSIVLTPGPWAGPILTRLGLNLPLQPVKIPVYYWRVRDFLPHTFIYECKGWDVWGLPPLEYKGLAKICLHEGPEIDPDKRDSVSTQELKASLQSFLRTHCPGVDPEVAIEESCIYTLTPDQNPIIDCLPERQNVVFGVGFSGMGFKLGPVTGRMLADLAQGKVKRQALECLSLRRFSTSTDGLNPS